MPNLFLHPICYPPEEPGVYAMERMLPGAELSSAANHASTKPTKLNLVSMYSTCQMEVVSVIVCLFVKGVVFARDLPAG